MDTKSNDDSGGSDSLDKSMQRKCVMVETTATTTTATNITTEPDNCSRDSATVQQEEDQDHQPSTPGGESAKANNNNNNNITTTATTTAASAAFETKVKLISQNLKETKLAEETGSDEVTTASASSNEQEEVQEEEPSGDRLKKVHFHPDAKESDGGNNRVKKKWKSSQNHGGDGANLGCDGMEMDVTEDEQNADGGENEAAEDEEEEEEEFNLAKTIAEAEDYLKQHPLTFVRRAEQNGELTTKEASQLEQEKMIEGDEDEHHEDNDDEDSEIDFYKNCKPENGIERILGKETKAGKVEFLLRFENQGGLSWESEEFIRCMCPTLLKLYELNRERRQQRLMHHVAKRQSLRQRYTDF